MFFLQTCGIIYSFNSDHITQSERDNLLGRMVTSTVLSYGSMVGSIAIMGTGPFGLAVGAGSCITVALADIKLGETVFSSIFGDPVQSGFDQLEKEVITKAYHLFQIKETWYSKL